MSFFNELKRRNVFKVAAAYIIVGWLIMQAGEVMSPALNLPGWVNSMLAFFLILGFPVAMVFAWAFEMTPEGLKKEKEVDRSESVANITGQKLNHAIIGLMAVALLYFAWDKFVASPASGVDQTQVATLAENIGTADESYEQKPDKRSIAVIPFRNRSANEENAEFFSDGVHDELLTNLSRIEELKVISRTSVMAYRDTTKNLRQIGEELGVANILEGGVQRSGDMVRINVQLIDAATDEHLWANVYDRELSAENIFAIQTEIARAIANALKATLTPREQEAIATTPTTNLEALDNLLLARQLIGRGNWQNLRDAQSYLKKVIELDPEFIEAYVLLAQSYFELYSTGAATLQEINTPWGDAIQTALSLDNNHANAQAIYALYLRENGQQGVDAAFEKARQLEPANAEIMAMYASHLRITFRLDQALPLYQAAEAIDPVSIPILFGLARIHEARHETGEARELYARIRQIDPANSTGYGPASGPYMIEGNLVQSLNWLFKALTIDPDDSDLYNWVALMYLDLDDHTSAGKWLTWIKQTLNANPMTPAGMARLSIHLGNIDASIPYTRRAFEENMGDRWGSDSIQVRALLIQALHQGKTSSALEIIRRAHPELFDQPPIINAGNILQAIDAANLLQIENHNDEARDLLLAVIATYEQPYTVSEAGLAPGKAQALALLGEKQAALDELQHQVDSGWRLFWRWHTELNPNFSSLHNDPEFKGIVEFLRTDMARQLEELRVMEANGEIPLPPGEGKQ